MNPAVLADPASRANHACAPICVPSPTCASSPITAYGPMPTLAAIARKRRNDRRRMDPRRDRRASQQQLGRFCERHFRLRAPQNGFSRQRHAFAGNHAERRGSRGPRSMFRALPHKSRSRASRALAAPQLRAHFDAAVAFQASRQSLPPISFAVCLIIKPRAKNHTPAARLWAGYSTARGPRPTAPDICE